MAKVTIQDGFGEYRKRFEEASEKGMDRAALVVEDRTKLDLSKLGVSPSGKRQNQDFSDFLERAEGLIDPPGGTPRLRTGLLRRSITFERSAPNLRRIGPAAGLVYPGGTPVGTVARAHELGATINHPGGTPYIVIKGKDGRVRAVFLRKSSRLGRGGKKTSQQRGAGRIKAAIRKGSPIKFTRAHRIVIPKRPFLRPALLKSKAAWTGAYYSEVNKVLAGIKDTTGGGA